MDNVQIVDSCFSKTIEDHSMYTEWNSDFVMSLKGCRDSVVGIAMGYGLDDQGVGVPSPGMVKNFLFSTLYRPALGTTHPPIQWVPEVKRPGREAHHSPLASADVKNMWICTSTPPIRPHGAVLN
jgi:hypothetical protein